VKRSKTARSDKKPCFIVRETTIWKRISKFQTWIWRCRFAPWSKQSLEDRMESTVVSIIARNAWNKKNTV
jgi:hypothetical protein